MRWCTTLVSLFSHCDSAGGVFVLFVTTIVVVTVIDNNNGLASKESPTFFLNQTLDQARAYLVEAQRASPALPLILGEGAFHNGGCSVGGCDSFGSSLYYLDALCKLSELGHEAFFRQSFVGGNCKLNSLIALVSGCCVTEVWKSAKTASLCHSCRCTC